VIFLVAGGTNGYQEKQQGIEETGLTHAGRDRALEERSREGAGSVLAAREISNARRPEG
jgi:hypothetical protein